MVRNTVERLKSLKVQGLNDFVSFELLNKIFIIGDYYGRI